MRDFIGTEILVGDYIAKGGEARDRAERGLILYRVTAFKGEKIKATRVDLKRFPHRSDLLVRKVTISNPNAIVVVQVRHEVSEFLERAIEHCLPASDIEGLSVWLHGRPREQPWDSLPVWRPMGLLAGSDAKGPA